LDDDTKKETRFFRLGSNKVRKFRISKLPYSITWFVSFRVTVLLDYETYVSETLKCDILI